MLLYVITAFLLFRIILSRSEVQERALRVVPGLCESIDYAEVQSVLFPRVAVRLFKPLPWIFHLRRYL
jgi:hypothetical protein